jgi:protein-disulfide isomerase
MTEHKNEHKHTTLAATEHHSTTHKTKCNTPDNRAILLGAGIIAIAILLHGVIVAKLGGSSAAKPTSIVTKEIVEKVLKGSTANRYFGDSVPTEAIVFTEFSDTECPFCKNYHATIEKVIAEGAGKYAWVYKHFPLSFHPKAQKQAEAIECVRSISGDQKALHYLDVIYAVTPSNNKLEESVLFEISDKMKLPTKKLRECVVAGTFAAKVQTDITEGESRGVSGTPFTFVTKGYGKDAVEIGTINGAQPVEAVEALLSQVK